MSRPGGFTTPVFVASMKSADETSSRGFMDVINIDEASQDKESNVY